MVTVSASSRKRTARHRQLSRVLVNTVTVLAKHTKLLWHTKRKMSAKYTNAHTVTSPARGQTMSSDTCCDTLEKDLTSVLTVTSVPRGRTPSRSTLKIFTIKISEDMNSWTASTTRISGLTAWLRIFTTRILEEMVLLDKMSIVSSFQELVGIKYSNKL